MPDQLQFEYDVFISYSSRDRLWVKRELLRRIEEAGLRAFVDFRDFQRGAPSITEMERGVRQCRKTLLVITSDYVDSEWCEFESIMSQMPDPANRNLRLIPLLRRDCAEPPRIGALTHIDFRDDADLALAWSQLLTSLSVPPKPSDRAIPSEIQDELDRAKPLVDADRFSEAIPILEKAMGAADTAGHVIARVKVRVQLAKAIYQAREDYAAAERLLRDALVLVPVESFDLKHRVLDALGDMLHSSGQLDEAKATIGLTVDMAKRSGNAHDLAGSLISLGLLERDLGLHESALGRINEALHLLLGNSLSAREQDESDAAHLIAVCYMNKAFLYRDAGNSEEALALYARVTKQQHVSELDSGRALLFSGEVHCSNGDWEKGLDCFGRALTCFKNISNSLWGARALEHIARFYATVDQWDRAMEAIYAAIAGAEESGHPGEQIQLLCQAAELGRQWKTANAKGRVALQLHSLAKNAPELTLSGHSAKINEAHDAIKEVVGEDEHLRDLLNRAKEIAQRENLSEDWANCFLEEARNTIAPDATEARQSLFAQALGLMKEELRKSQFPKQRGHLMGRISELCWRMGEQVEGEAWLKKAGEVFERSGDASGLANYHAALAEMHRAEGRLEDEIAEHRKVLSIIEGRSFHRLAAGTRISLAAALRGDRSKSDEVKKLLNEAEALCNKHYFKDFFSAIAQIRSTVEKEVQAAQAPTHTIQELLNSLRQLLEYRREYAVAYLAFWYFAWNTEILSLLRSGPRLSFMVITDNVERFTKFAANFRHVADYFLMSSSGEPLVKAEPSVIPIPPDWKFPARFTFVAVRRETGASGQTERQASQSVKNDVRPDIRPVGPATMFPLYVPISQESSLEGELHVMALSEPHLPQEAIDLMIRRPIEELIELRAICFPTNRYSETNPFLTDLLSGLERGVFPVYFDRLPFSNAVADCGGVEIALPHKFLSGALPAMESRWRRALLKLTKLTKQEAQAALLDLPEVFVDRDSDEITAGRGEIHLFEFNYRGHQVFHPVVLVREITGEPAGTIGF